MLLPWIFGYFFSWRTTAFLLAIPQIVLNIFIIPLHETPYFLIECDNVEAAKKSLSFYRGKSYDISKELQEIEDRHESKKNEADRKSWKFVVRRICSSTFFKPFSCIGVLYIMDSWVGSNELITFTFEILNKAGSSINPGEGLIAIGTTRLIFAGIDTNPKFLFVINSFLNLFKGMSHYLKTVLAVVLFAKVRGVALFESPRT